MSTIDIYIDSVDDPMPTGTMTITIDGIQAGTLPVPTFPRSSYFYTTLTTIGPHVIKVDHPGDANYLPGSRQITTNVYGERRPIGFSDLNNDGTTDIVWRNTSTGEVGEWLLKGASIMGSGSIGAAPPTMTIAGFGDFDGDGKTDILWRDSIGGVGVWLMNGTTIREGKYIEWASLDYQIAAVCDLDHDGTADILWQRYSDRSIPPGRPQETGVWFIRNAAIKSGAFLGFTSSLEVEGVGDFDGNGEPDILFRGPPFAGTAYQYATVQNGTMTAIQLIRPVGYSLITAGIGDFDHDGKTDILTREVTTGDVFLWPTGGVPQYVGGSDRTLTIRAVADYDGDGNADVLWTDPGGGVGLWLMNGPTIATGVYVGSATPVHATP